jgi:hypothetical protein
MSMQPAHGWQEPLWQVLPIEQLVHAAPPVPQRDGVNTVMQTPAEVQQPDGHVAAEQDPVPPPPPVAPPPPPVAPPPPPVPERHAPLLQVLEPPQI